VRTIPQTELAVLRETAVDAARKAATVLLNWVQRADEELGIMSKGDGSPVSKADFASHATITALLEPLGFPILSEEGLQQPWEERQHWDWFWLVDPLDGTEAFVRFREGFAVNIAFCGRQGPMIGVVADPCGGEIFSGLVGEGARRENLDGSAISKLRPNPPSPPYRLVTSRNEQAAIEALLPPGIERHEVTLTPVSGALKFCLIAAGEAEIHSRTGAYMEWDCAAGDGVLRSMGLDVRDRTTDRPLEYNKPSLWVHGLWTSRVQR